MCRTHADSVNIIQNIIQVFWFWRRYYGTVNQINTQPAQRSKRCLGMSYSSLIENLLSEFPDLVHIQNRCFVLTGGIAQDDQVGVCAGLESALCF